MIDFGALTLGPAMAAFARPVTVTPGRSNPPRAPFAASGIWTITRQTDIPLEGGETLVSVEITLGIRLADWAYPPEQFVSVRVPAAGSYPDEGTFWIDRVNEDHQGGATLILKRGKPPE